MSDKYARLRPRRHRHCYRADRVPKRKFTRWEARAKAEEHPGYRAYRCPSCGHWHVGKAAKEAQR